MKYSNFKGDLSGAIANTIIVIPMAIGYGIIVLAPLGLEYTSRGALMGVYAAIFCAFFSSLVGGTPAQMTGPKATMALVLAAVVEGLAANPLIPESLASKSVVIIGLVAVCVCIGGIFQLIFGALRFGNLVKYVPSPVIAGFMNGIALLLIIKQAKPLMGISSKTSYMEILSQPQAIQPFTLIVGILTLSALFITKRHTKLIPAPLAALALGIIGYYLFYFTVGAPSLGPVIGAIPSALPKPDVFLNLIKESGHLDLWAFIPPLIIPGIFLGILGSMESLLSAVVCANLTGVRPNSNKELVGQGVGNVVSSLFGGLPGAGSVPGVMTNYEAGGRTPASGMISGLASLVVIGALGQLVGKIPLTVIAGIVIAVGITMIDKQTLTLLRRPANLFKQRKDVLINLAVNLLVAIITVTVNLLVAVAVGVAIATAMFVSKIGKSVINRKFTGDITHSKKVRNLTQQDILQDIGREIVIFELNGPLFFGSADKLASEIEISMEDATYCILDMKRVNEIDSTGVDILIQINKILEKKKKRLLIAHLKEKPSLWEPVEALVMAETLREDHFFHDTDTALEWAEDHLLVEKGFLPDEHAEALLPQMDIVKGFSSDELNVFRENLALKKVKKGELVIVEGDPGTEMFLLLKGSVSVKLRLAGGDRSKRLVSFSPGVIFGEMALLDEGPRSADVVADEDSEMFQLSLSNFQMLRRDHPELATKLILNMALWLSERLRVLSQEVRLLEEA